MRFYKLDGSCEIQQGDCNFGWWLNEICIDDGYFDCERRNKKLRYKEENFTVTVSYQPSAYVHDPIRVEEMSSIECCDKNCIKFSNSCIDDESCKDKLTAMISSNTSRSRLLMSLIDFPRYKSLGKELETSESEIKPIVELEKPSIFLNCLYPSDLKYHRKKSLLEEISCEKSRDNNCLFVCDEKHNGLNGCEKIKRNDFNEQYLSLNSELLYVNIENLRRTLFMMRMELIIIRNHFSIEEQRTAQMLKESKALLREIKDTSYINEMLILLMGKTETIKSDYWPFRILSKQTSELNLII